ncbi:hypothetical protein [Actinomadura nitritigenes]|uniref:hypothetical protein n=1 Tax=Actinomadura nitritigenes TaxID=134602 RepID=UPI003D8A0095
MSERTETGGLSAETRAVIVAVLDAVDIPYAATVAHEETRAKILADRVMHLVVHLRSVADRGHADALARDLEYLRERLDENPAAGYVTSEQARARCDAGAGWMDAVRLDYDSPAVDAQDDEDEVSATVPGTWPGGEPTAVRAAEDEPDERHVRVAEDIIALADRGPVFDRLADQVRAGGDQGAADAVTRAADACRTLRAVLDGPQGKDAMRTAIEQVHAALARAVPLVRAFRATVDEVPGSRKGYLIPPPADPAMRAEWAAGVAARDAAGLSGFVGEDYPNAEGGRS